MSIDWTKVITATDKFNKAKTTKLSQVSASFSDYCKDSFTTTYGWPMQFGETDVQKMEGAIKLIEADSTQTPYVVDANDVLHTSVTLSDMKAIQLEMMQHYAAAYYQKQQLRAVINACTTQAELDAINIIF